MSEPRDGASDSLGDLFDNLPTAASPLPGREERAQPAPGSRRARREAAQRGSAGAVADAPTDGTTHAPTPEPAGAPEADARPSPAQAAPEQDGDADSASGPAPASSPDPDDVDSLSELFAPNAPARTAKKRRGRGCLIAFIVVLVVLGGIAAGGAYVWNIYGDKISDAMGWGEPKDWEAGQATGEAYITIKNGDTGSPVSTALYEAKVTKTDRVFYQYLVDNNVKFTLYPGVYKLQQKMTAADALKALNNPENRMENTVRIAEGSTVESSLPRIVEGVGVPLEELQDAVADPSVYGVDADRLEGWLFPAVYTFDPDVTAEQVIKRMVDRTRQSLEKAGVSENDAQRVLTIASIIEREARTADFGKVSQVIVNRLAIDMRLQMDSTSQYGYGELHAGKASTSKEAQHDKNDWNTYEITGLPKTPIANPGDAAISAAENPEPGPWLYFVTVNMNTGETQFSETLEEHERGVAKMREWCKANPGTGC